MTSNEAHYSPLLTNHPMSDYRIVVGNRSSGCISAIVVDPVYQTADVGFLNNDIVYRYVNVPTKELFRLIHHDDISLGKWVNKVCKRPEVRCIKKYFD